MSERNRFPRSMLLVIISLLTLIILVVPGSISYGQEKYYDWSKPIALSNRVPSSWFPDIAVDESGRIHVVWSSTMTTVEQEESQGLYPGYDVVMYTSSLDGISWEEPIDIVARPQEGGSEALRPVLNVGSGDRLDLTYRLTDVYYTNVSAGSVQTSEWLPPRQISLYGVGYFSSLAQDRSGTLHLAYTQNIPAPNCPICYHVLYRHSSDIGQSWSPVIDISLLPTGAAKPQLLIDSDDNVQIVWEGGRGGSYGAVVDPARVMYAASYDGGDTWTLPMDFETSGIARNVVIGEDGQGRLIAVWQNLPQNEINYQFSEDNGRSWSRAMLIPSIWGGWSVYNTRHDNYAMATDSAGDLHLVMAGRLDKEQESINLLHLVWEDIDGVWSEPEVIQAYSGDIPEWPRIAIDEDDELHIVWYVRDKAHIWDTDLGRYQIWYSRTLTEIGDDAQIAKATITQVSDTATPISVATSPTQTMTPIPSQAMDDGHLDEKTLPQSESEALLVIGISIIPAAILLLAVFVSVRIRRS